MTGAWQFNMDTVRPETIERLVARRASICDLLKAGALRGEVVRGSLKLVLYRCGSHPAVHRSWSAWVGGRCQGLLSKGIAA